MQRSGSHCFSKLLQVSIKGHSDTMRCLMKGNVTFLNQLEILLPSMANLKNLHRLIAV